MEDWLWHIFSVMASFVFGYFVEIIFGQRGNDEKRKRGYLRGWFDGRKSVLSWLNPKRHREIIEMSILERSACSLEPWLDVKPGITIVSQTENDEKTNKEISVDKLFDECEEEHKRVMGKYW